MLCVKAQGVGRTRLEYEKTRWSSLQGTAVTLLWRSNYGYAPEEKEDKPTDEDITDRIKDLYQTEDKLRTREQIRQEIGAGATQTKRSIDELLTEGWLHEISGADVPGQRANTRLFTHTAQLLPNSLESWAELGKLSTEHAGLRPFAQPPPPPTEGGGGGSWAGGPAGKDNPEEFPF
jgi:hypothetical protein